MNPPCFRYIRNPRHGLHIRLGGLDWIEKIYPLKGGFNVVIDIQDRPVAPLIPDPDQIRSALKRAELEAALLRKLLRLALSRESDSDLQARFRQALQQA